MLKHDYCKIINMSMCCANENLRKLLTNLKTSIPEYVYTCQRNLSLHQDQDVTFLIDKINIHHLYMINLYHLIQRENMSMCSELHYTTRENGGWRHDNEPVGRVVMSPYANPRVVQCHSEHMPNPFLLLYHTFQCEQKSNTHLLKPFITRCLYGRQYMQAKHADACSDCLFWTACTSRPHVLPLPSRREKSDSWRQAGSVKTVKKSWTVCCHVTLNCVQWRRMQAKVEFSSHVFQYTRFHSVAVISCWRRNYFF